MLAIFLDVQNEILDISREFGVMQRKVRRFELAEDLEDKDSHKGPSPDVSTAFTAGWIISPR